MRAVLQRVRRARVSVGGEVKGAIGEGYVALIGVERGDTNKDAVYLARKIAGLRLFDDGAGKMNEPLGPERSVLAISQFTLCGDTRRGLRPSFDAAMPAGEARPLYEAVVEEIRMLGVRVETGVFQADMNVELVNWGPVTVLLSSR